MAHQITEIDSIDSISLEWHGLNRVRTQSELNLFAGSALDWQVERLPAYFEGGELAGNFVATRHNGKIIPLVHGEDSYQFIQNEELFQTFQILIEEFGFNLECLGSIYGKKRVFFTLSNGEELRADKVGLKLNVTSSHDKSSLTEFFTSAIRIVCANTWKFAKDSKTSDFAASLRKTRNVHDRIATVKAALIEYASLAAEANDRITEMQATKVEEEQAKVILAGFLNPKGTRGFNQVDSIVDLFKSGKGNSGQNAYDLFNGITEFFTHAPESKKEAGDIWTSSEFGAFAAHKARAWELLPNAIPSLEAKGLEVLG